MNASKVVLYGLFFFFSCFGQKDVLINKKIAFVKQVIYQDLYCASSTEPMDDFIFSSFLRSGPVALFTRFNTHFYIVEVEDDEECNIWKETLDSSTECKFTFSMLQSQRDRVPSGRIYPQKFYAIKCDQVNWSEYDIVIALNCAVPARITKKHPSVLWAYCIGEHTTSSHKKSFMKPIDGYDVFLTLDFFAKRFLKKHVIEFPYQLQYYGCFYELLEKNITELRKDIHIESWTMNSLTSLQKEELAQIVKLRDKKNKNYGSLKNLVKSLISSKYFIIFLSEKSKRTFLRGNCIPEAIAAGCLVIAKENSILNKDLLSSRTLVSTFEELLRTIKFFEQNPQEYALEVNLQRKKLDELCFYRPIQQLFLKHDEKQVRINKVQSILGE